jgi:hypothetical protein
MHRKNRDASRGSPRSFAAQRTLARDDNALVHMTKEISLWQSWLIRKRD